MAIIGKSLILGAAFLAGDMFTANANPVGSPLILVRASRDLAALLPSAATPSPDSVTAGVTVFAPHSNRGIGHRVSSFETIRTEHYEVPPDFDGNVPLYPYTSGIGPWTRGPQWPVVNDRFQCLGITG